MRIRWLKDARLEAAESARFYRDKDVELATAFTREIRSKLDYAQRFPEAGTRLGRTQHVHVRRLLMDRFEYALVFALLDDELLVLAVHHQHRRPGYWRPRLAHLRKG